jgi:hypothetical protein
MNLNKYSKTELIDKLSKLEKSNKPESKFKRSYLDIKQYIVTLFLSGIISNVFKRYKLWGRVFRFLNWIIVSIFGISLIDSFNLWSWATEIKKVSTSILTYILSTSIYQYFLAINPFQFQRKEPYTWESNENIKKSSRIHKKTHEMKLILDEVTRILKSLNE